MRDDIDQLQGVSPGKTNTNHDRMQKFDQIVTYNPGIDYNYDADVMLKH
jgi:hypothetical protein